VVTRLWCLAQSPVLTREIILPRSVTNFSSDFVSKNVGSLPASQKAQFFGAAIILFDLFTICFFGIYLFFHPEFISESFHLFKFTP